MAGPAILKVRRGSKAPSLQASTSSTTTSSPTSQHFGKLQPPRQWSPNSLGSTRTFAKAVYAKLGFFAIIMVLCLCLFSMSLRLIDDYNMGLAIEDISTAAGGGDASSNRALDTQDAYQDLHLINGEAGILRKKIVLPDLHMYYMNLDKSKDRRVLMEAMFEELNVPKKNVHRIASTDVTVLHAMLDDGSFKLENNVTLEDPGGDPVWLKRSQQRYDFKEAACLLSHLRAIKHAYDSGYEMALILEDDARLTPKFVRYWKQYAALAPKDWTLLQWSEDFNIIYEQGLQMTNDPWVSYKHEHWAARANLYNRKGMENILSRTYRGKDLKTGKDLWGLTGEPTLVADELVYVYSERTYTSTKPWIGRFDVETTLQEAGEKQGENPYLTSHSIPADVPKLDFPQRKESVMVVTQYFWESVEDALQELGMLELDVEGICQFHKQCFWHVNVLVSSESILGDSAVKQKMESFPPSILLYTSVQDPKMHQAMLDKHPPVGILLSPVVPGAPPTIYKFVAMLAEKMGNYDLVLIKEFDVRTAGFAWDTFVDKKGRALVASPLRQDPTEGKFNGIGKIRRFEYRIQDGQEWQRAWYTPWSSEIYATIGVTRVPYIEYYMTLMDGDFAAWFFPLSLPTDHFLDTVVREWSPDLLWCEGAREYMSYGKHPKPPCHLVPLVAQVEPYKELALEGEPNWYSKSTDPKTVYENDYVPKDERYQRWMTTAKFWKETAWWQDLKLLEGICTDKPYLKDPSIFTLQECMDVATNTTVVAY